MLPGTHAPFQIEVVMPPPAEDQDIRDPQTISEIVKAEVSHRLTFRAHHENMLAAMPQDALAGYMQGMRQARLIAELGYADLLRSMSPEQRASFSEKPPAVARQAVSFTAPGTRTTPGSRTQCSATRKLSRLLR